MVKKLFVLASVTALTGLMATAGASGCSSTTTVSDTSETGPGTGSEGGVTHPVEASITDEDTSTGPTTCPDSTPVTAAQVEMADGTFKPPAAIQSVCMQSNLDDLKAAFVKGGGSLKFADIQTALGATCSACVFSKEADTNWGPIVMATTGGGFLQNDGPSCVSQLGGATCGKSFFDADNCLIDACPDTCTDQSGCGTKAAKGPCKAIVAQANTDCPDLTNELDICGGIVDSIKVNCGGGPDGGLDSAVQ